MFPGAITDVHGILAGHHTHDTRPTGCSVVLCPEGAVCGVDARGAAPGTRETDVLRADNLVEQVHAVLLTGGSAFGLDAAGGVMRWFEERGHGYAVGPLKGDGPSARQLRVPIVPAAVLFDLWLGDPGIRPDAASGYAACEAAATSPPAQGSVGAGAGATVGKLFGLERAMKGGVGTASLRVGAVTVGALVAVNAVGDVIDRSTGQVLAGARGADGGAPAGITAALLRGEGPAQTLAGMATTIGVVATDATITKAQAARLATMAHDGLARSIDPVHTMADGDVLFAIATGRNARGNATPTEITVLGALAAEVTARAVTNAIRAATGLPQAPSARDLGRA